MKRYLKAGLYLAFWACVFCMLFFVLKPVIIGWEGHTPLFRYTGEFFKTFFHSYHSQLFLFNNFLVQFGYYPALGALIYSGLFTLLAFLINTWISNTDKVSPWGVVPGMAVAACLLPGFSFTFCIMPLIVLFMVLGAGVWKATAKPGPLNFIFRLLLMAPLTHILREYTLVAWVLYTVMDFNRKDNRYGKTALESLGYLCLWSLWGLVFYRIWQPYEFYTAHILFGFSDLNPTQILFVPFMWFDSSIVSVILLWAGTLILFLLPFLRHINGQKMLTVCGCIGIALGIFSFCAIPCNATEQVENFYKTDKLCREYRWGEALKRLNSQYKDIAGSQELTHNLVIQSTQIKLCLLAQRKASGQIFTYNLPTFPHLFPEELVNRAESYLTPVYYRFAGNFTENLHQNYDWVTCMVTNPYVLEEILITSLILNDTMPASKVLYMFEKSLFRGKRARDIFNGKNAFIQSQIDRGRKMVSPANYAVTAYWPDKNAERNFLFQPQNYYFAEYFITLCMVNKNPWALGANFDEILRYYPQGVPRHVQEALMSTFQYNMSRLSYPSRIDGVDKDVLNDYWMFLMDNSSYQLKKMSFADLSQRWRHTYWFYDLYIIKSIQKHEN